jgi:TolB-like protein/Tfp pilus assembly protein PilF
VIGAWVFQFTPDGLMRDRGADLTPVASKHADRNLDRAIIVILVLGISYFAVDKFLLAPDRAAEREAEVAEQARSEAIVGFYGDRSIAVLPFDNMTSDPEQEFFVDGIAEEVLNLLARIRELRVISRSSAFAFKGQGLEVPEIARRLDVAHVLEGSVRKFGNTVRVTAQLIEARTDTHLWSHTYERELENVFAIQDEIAADVVANLQIELLNPLPRSRYVDPEAISLTAQAKQLAETRPEDVGRKMYSLLSRALEVDPNYIPALEWMTTALWLRDIGDENKREELDRRFEQINERIRQLDPDNASPDYFEAFRLSREGKFEEAAAMYLAALSKDLSLADNVRIAGYFARKIGKFDMSVRLLEHALAIDPLCHQCRLQYSSSLMYRGDYERAQQELERYQVIGSGGWTDYISVLLLQGKAKEALAYIDSLGDENEYVVGASKSGQAMARFSQGETVESDAALAELMALQVGDKRVLTFAVTRTAAWMGKNDLAFENLFEMSATNFIHLRSRAFSPIWQGLHDDPRWDAWRESIGISAERLDAIEFNPNLPE